MEIKLKEKQKHTFRSITIRITKNLDYRLGGEELFTGKLVRTIVCPKSSRKYFMKDTWVLGTKGPLRLDNGEYDKIKKG